MDPVVIGAVISVTWLAWWDLVFRRAPNWLTLPLMVLGSIANWPWGPVMALVVWLLVEYAGFCLSG